MVPAVVVVVLSLVGAAGAIALLAGPVVAWADRLYRHSVDLRRAAMVLGLLTAVSGPAAVFAPDGVGDVLGAVFAVAAVGALVLVAVVAPTFRRAPAALIRPRRILAVGAHPDDLELACGATLAKLVEAGHEVYGLVMSHGESGGDGALRPGEAARGSGYLGVGELSVHGFEDTRLPAHSAEMVKVIEQAILAFRPDVVLTHSAHDQHQDHEAVHFATLRAARRCPSILCFESPSVTREFNPAFFVDVRAQLEVKVHAIALHRDQAAKPYMTPEEVRGIAAFRGAQAKLGFAEGFEVVRVEASAAGML